MDALEPVRAADVADGPPEEAIGRLTAEAVGKTYVEQDRSREVLKDLHLTLEAGRVTVVMGPSGCGKSCLINLLAGYEPPTAGRVVLDGRPTAGPGPDRLAVFQETALFPWLTAFENVAYGPKIRKELKGAQLESAVMELLRLVGLEDFRDKYPAQLSGGMQRRAELVRALANRPKVMLLDEPFRGLDAMTRGLMRDVCLTIFRRHRGSSLFVTSELDEGLALADQLAIFTNRPAKVKKLLDVPFERPRTDQLRSSPAYLALKAEALELLHEEAVKSFKTGAIESADFVEAYGALA
ncbi:MAG: ABC transporter ATP-binding protein [Deltaproteobacteria bacterium]|nr:ABC transporter ATP-binding protein [Deltaproteobacteria bacterium]